MPSDSFRVVFLAGHFAIKLPKIKNFFQGLRCNRWEREMWLTWRPIFGWSNLCPVLYSDWLGLIVIMPRAVQPVPFQEIVESFPEDDYPSANIEIKAENFGYIDHQIVAVDYGIHEKDLVTAQRSYYLSKKH